MTIDDIAARHAASTPGEWRNYANEYVGTVEEDSQTIAYASDHRNRKMSSFEQRQANAQFIAHAHQDIPFLLAEITRLTAALADAESRGRRDGLEEARRFIPPMRHGQGAYDFPFAKGYNGAREDTAKAINAALAQSPEDGKQEKV